MGNFINKLTAIATAAILPVQASADDTKSWVNGGNLFWDYGSHGRNLCFKDDKGKDYFNELTLDLGSHFAKKYTSGDWSIRDLKERLNVVVLAMSDGQVSGQQLIDYRVAETRKMSNGADLTQPDNMALLVADTLGQLYPAYKIEQETGIRNAKEFCKQPLGRRAVIESHAKGIGPSEPSY